MIIKSFGYTLRSFYRFFKCKMATVKVQAKRAQKSYFQGSKPILKFFVGYFYPLTIPMQKKGSKWSLNMILQGWALKAPPFSMFIPEAPSGRVKVFPFCVMVKLSKQELVCSQKRWMCMFQEHQKINSNVFRILLIQSIWHFELLRQNS